MQSVYQKNLDLLEQGGAESLSNNDVSVLNKATRPQVRNG